MLNNYLNSSTLEISNKLWWFCASVTWDVFYTDIECTVYVRSTFCTEDCKNNSLFQRFFSIQSTDSTWDFDIF